MRVAGGGFRVEDLGNRVDALATPDAAPLPARVQVVGFRVQGLGFSA